MVLLFFVSLPAIAAGEDRAWRSRESDEKNCVRNVSCSAPDANECCNRGKNGMLFAVRVIINQARGNQVEACKCRLGTFALRSGSMSTTGLTCSVGILHTTTSWSVRLMVSINYICRWHCMGIFVVSSFSITIIVLGSINGFWCIMYSTTCTLCSNLVLFLNRTLSLRFSKSRIL